MSKTLALSTSIRELARRFAEDMGYNTISVTKFDLWIIDQGMADDPGTSDTKKAKYRAFVADRNKALQRLRANGMNVPEGLRFDILITAKGVAYEVIEYVAGVEHRAGRVGLNIRGYVESQSNITNRDGKKLAGLYNMDRGNAKIQSALIKNNFMKNQALIMERQIQGIVNQFEQGMKIYSEEILLLTEDTDKTED